MIDPSLRPPSLALLMLEPRALAEWVHFRVQAPRLRGLPRGDGHAVLVLPGFGASDGATAPLRRALKKLGYAAYGWGLGRNRGPRKGLREGLAQRLQQLHAAHGPVTLIGWSLGGVYARELARHQPQRVRQVFTLGSPINGHPDANNAAALFRRVNPAFRSNLAEFEQRTQAPPVRCVAIHTRSDGVVHWRCAQENPGPLTENIEVRGSHCGLVCNTQVLARIAERLPRTQAALGA